MIFITHGSHDSTDLDRAYVFDEKPSFRECQRFCSESEENRNIIVVRGGVVSECFKGLPDEVNNALLRTYGLHAQHCPNPITRFVLRNVPLKLARGIRVVLTRMTRTSYRAPIKSALRAYDFNATRRVLASIDFRHAELDAGALKSIAFQFGQMSALIDGAELYTKQEIVAHHPGLDPFLYRDHDPRQHLVTLNRIRDALLSRTVPVRSEPRGVLNLFMTARPPTDLLLKQSRGMLCDLKAERCLAMPPDEVTGPLALAFPESGGGVAFVGTEGFDTPTAEVVRAHEGGWEGLDLSRYHAAFCEEGGAVKLVGMRDRRTGDEVAEAQVKAVAAGLSA